MPWLMRASTWLPAAKKKGVLVLSAPTPPGQAGNGAAALTAFSLACAFVLDFYLMRLASTLQIRHDGPG